MKLLLAAAAIFVLGSQAKAEQPFPVPDKYYVIISNDDPSISLGEKPGKKLACQDTWDQDVNLWKFVKEGKYFRLFNKASSKDKITAFKKGRFGVYDGPNYTDQLWEVKPLGGRKVSIKNHPRHTKISLTAKAGECGLSKKNAPNDKFNVWLLDDQFYNPSVVIPEGAQVVAEGDALAPKGPKCASPGKISKKGISCKASSDWSNKYKCANAFDKETTCKNKHGWYQKNKQAASGQYIQASFSKKMIITSVKIANTYRPAKDVTITFDGKNPTTGTLDPACGKFKEISLAEPVEAKDVRITINSISPANKKKYMGIKEIEIFGCKA